MRQHRAGPSPITIALHHDADCSCSQQISKVRQMRAQDDANSSQLAGWEKVRHGLDCQLELFDLERERRMGR